MKNSFGYLYKLTSFGESHGQAIGGVIDGCPANIVLDPIKIQKQLDRRKPGQNKYSTPRKEADDLHLLSGIENNKTLGTPLGFFIKNRNTKPTDYANLQHTFRPSHGDYTTSAKYQTRASSGGGRISARETIARVVAGSIAEQVLQTKYRDLKIVAYVDAIHTVTMQQPIDGQSLTRCKVDQSQFRCPDDVNDKKIVALIENCLKTGDSVGGTIRCVIIGVPVGLGEPVFDKLQATLAHAIMSIPACKGFEIGSGFASSTVFGSQNNDPFYMANSQVRTRTNYSGGIQGGISNGEAITLRVAFKPPSSIRKSQESVTNEGKSVELSVQGRHDPCVLPRAVPIVESMVAMTLLDALLIQQATTLSP